MTDNRVHVYKSFLVALWDGDRIMRRPKGDSGWARGKKILKAGGEK
jgi:hypothetical protein